MEISDDTIRNELIYSADGVLIQPTELTSPDQRAILDCPTKSDLLSLIYHKAFRSSGNRAYLDAAILCSRRCLAISSLANPLRKKRAFRLGNYLTSRCDRFEAREDLDEAILVLVESLSLHPEDSDQEECSSDSGTPVGNHGDLIGYPRTKALSALARAYRLRYQSAGSLEDFDNSLGAQLEARDIYEDLEMNEKLGDSERMAAILYEDKYLKDPEDTGAFEALESAIVWAERSTKTSKGFDVWARCMDELVGLLERRYERTHNNEDIVAAIDCWEERFVEKSLQGDKTSPDDVGSIQFELGRLYLMLTSLTQLTSDGSEASGNAQRALHCTPANHPDRPKREELWRQCATVLSDTVGLDIRGKPTNAELKAQRKMIASENDSALKANMIQELSSMHHGRFMSDESTQELKLAKDHSLEAARLTPANEEKAIVQRYEMTGYLCMELAKSTFNDDYLNEGILWSREAVRACQFSNSITVVEKAVTMGNLSRIILTKLSEEANYGRSNGALISEAFETVDNAVGLIREVCNGNDSCGYCKDREELLEDLEILKERYPP